MKDTRFAYAVAYMRTLENRMLDASDIDALLGMADAAEAVRYLAERHYGGVETAEGKRGIDGMLKAELAQTWEEIREICPKGAPMDVLLYQNDFQNLKTILKAVFSDTDWQGLMLQPVTVEPELIYRAVSENEQDLLPPLLRKSTQEAYETLARTGDGRRAEVLIDKAAFAAIRKAAKDADSSFLLGWIDLWETLSNMKTALRIAPEQKSKEAVREFLLPEGEIDADVLAGAAAQGKKAVLTTFSENGYAEAARAAEQSVGEFEKWSDNTLMAYVKEAKNRSFGFEPLLAFLLGKQAEIQAVRIILYGLLNHIPKSILKERLRGLYV